MSCEHGQSSREDSKSNCFGTEYVVRSAKRPAELRSDWTNASKFSHDNRSDPQARKKNSSKHCNGIAHNVYIPWRLITEREWILPSFLCSRLVCIYSVLYFGERDSECFQLASFRSLIPPNHFKLDMM
uniref:Uncharacterized protein n=1 Tax=Physcomitrium patens TaxID=3218 RepID=A0A2K1IN80_PHYPA|nr:hypothetical protein PHYPA_027047 [Physcomitrium patens]